MMKKLFKPFSRKLSTSSTVLESLYRDVQKLHLENSQHLLNGPLWKKEDEKLYLLHDGQWHEKHTHGAAHDQGAVIHGDELHYFAIKENCQKMLRDGHRNGDKKIGWISRSQEEEELIFKAGRNEQIKLELLSKKECSELLGAEIAEKIAQYKNARNSTGQSHKL